MKIYLAGSMAGGRQFSGSLPVIARIIQNLGHEILSPFVVDEKLNEKRFSNLTGKKRARALFDEDLKLVKSSDAIIAEVSQPSTGLGTELGYAVGLYEFANIKKPVLLLRHESLREVRNSNLILGNPIAEFRYYDNFTLGKIIKSFLNKND